MVVIERLAYDHVPAVTLLAHAFYYESPSFKKQGAFDVEATARFITSYTQEPNIGWVALDDGVPVGAMLAYLARPQFGTELIAQEDSLYVTPEYRGTRVGLRLIRAFEQWALEVGASSTVLGVSSGIDQDRTVRFYERLGYEPFGVSLRRSF